VTKKDNHNPPLEEGGFFVIAVISRVLKGISLAFIYSVETRRKGGDYFLNMERDTQD